MSEAMLLDEARLLRVERDEARAEIVLLNDLVAEWSRQNLAIVGLEVEARKRAEAAEARVRALEEERIELEAQAESAAEQTQMLDRIAAALGLAHDEGLEDADAFVSAIHRLEARGKALEAE